jgi:hypothetical protein
MYKLRYSILCPRFQAKRLAAGCPFPYISQNITDASGVRVFCDETYADRIAPLHTVQCLIHSVISGILMAVLALWAVNAYTDYAETIPRKRGLEYRYKMHSFGALAAFCNLLASADLKGYAARLPLLAVEILNEFAYSALLCLLFHMVRVLVRLSWPCAPVTALALRRYSHLLHRSISGLT